MLLSTGVRVGVAAEGLSGVDVRRSNGGCGRSNCCSLTPVLKFRMELLGECGGLEVESAGGGASEAKTRGEWLSWRLRDERTASEDDDDDEKCVVGACSRAGVGSEADSEGKPV